MSNAPIQPIPAVMTTNEVATFLRTSPETVARYVHAHQLVAIQIGRERRFRAEDVLEFVATRSCTARCDRRQFGRKTAPPRDTAQR